jgi:uncharacterized membrane protein YfcA
LTTLEFILSTAVVTIGATLQGSVGLGLGMFGAPMLMLIDPRFIPGPLLCAALVLTLLLAHRERHCIHWPDLRWALSGRVVGIVLGLGMLASVSPDRLRLIFGVLILVGVAISASGFHLRIGRRTLVVAGALSGLMGTTISVGGPAMALIYQHSSGARIRGTLSAYFVVGVSLSLVGLNAIGLFGREQLMLAAALLPGILLGYWLSRRTASALDKGYTRVAVLTVSAAAAILVMLRQLLAG